MMMMMMMIMTIICHFTHKIAQFRARRPSIGIICSTVTVGCLLRDKKDFVRPCVVAFSVLSHIDYLENLMMMMMIIVHIMDVIRTAFVPLLIMIMCHFTHKIP